MKRFLRRSTALTLYLPALLASGAILITLTFSAIFYGIARWLVGIPNGEGKDFPEPFQSILLNLDLPLSKLHRWAMKP